MSRPAGNLGAMQFNSLNIFVREVQRYATQIMVTGYASAEGDENHNNTLAQNRANAVASYLRVQMPGISFTTWNGGTLDGDPKDYPTFRRAEVKVDFWRPGVTVISDPDSGDSGDQPGTGGDSGQPGTGSDSGSSDQPNFPGVDTGSPLPIYFDTDEAALVDATADGFSTGQRAELDTFATNALPLAFIVAVRGFAAPDDDVAGKPTLALDRANTVANYLRPKLHADFTVDDGGTLSGNEAQFPQLRRVEVFIDVDVVSFEPPTLRSPRSAP